MACRGIDRLRMVESPMGPSFGGRCPHDDTPRVAGGPEDRGGSPGRPLHDIQAWLPEAPGWLSAAPTLRWRFLSLQKGPDRLRSRNSWDQADLSITHDDRHFYEEHSGQWSHLVKPNCIVYIIHLYRTDKENFGWPGPELKFSSGRTGAAAVPLGKRLRRVTRDCSMSQRGCSWSEALTARPSMRSRRRPA